MIFRIFIIFSSKPFNDIRRYFLIYIFNEYFKNFTYTYGYKILNVYDKNNNFIENKKIIHITRNKENENINLINLIDSKIMFCVPSKNNFNNKLKLKNIIPINKMCIFGFNCYIKNWEHIETHMI
jgi:hypothetical protein